MNVWDEKADWWKQRFTGGADYEYEQQMLPLIESHSAGASRVLDVGTGEGQVARRVAACAGVSSVVGIDTSTSMIENARRAGGDVHYEIADATSLPFDDGSFDAVVMSLVLEHVDAFEMALSEAARVLIDGGRLLVFLNHPAFQTPGSGWIDDRILDEQYWRSGPYLGERVSMEEVDAGVTIAFNHRPLSAYVNCMARNGLLVTEMIEPEPETVEQYPEASSIPRLLFLRAELLR